MIRRIIDRIPIISRWVSSFFPPQVSRALPDLTDDEILSILRDRVERAKTSVGVVVGIIDDGGRRIISYGRPYAESHQTVDGDSVFEIGSVTKVFTALLLMDMAARGEVHVHDPISMYVPSSVKTPMYEGKEITLLHLANQTSGLPYMPSNFDPQDHLNPYIDYSLEQMFAFLSSYTLTRGVGATYEYSNYGVGLLGQLLALRAGTDYETLLQTRICQPLHLDATGIQLSPAMQARLTQGHNAILKPVGNWDMTVFAGAGALRSTVQDMLTFVALNMGLIESPFFGMMQEMHVAHCETGIAGLEVGLGWHVLKRFDTEIVWHNGGTGGYHSFIGFCKRKRQGVVVLVNSTNNIDDIGRHILERQYALAQVEPLKVRHAIDLDPQVFDSYVGMYQFSPTLTMSFYRRGATFLFKVIGEGPCEIFAETKTDFFIETEDVRFSFIYDDAGNVTKVMFRQPDVEQCGERIG